jgi:hypothetical protein
MMKILLLATSLFLSTFLFGQNDSIPSAYQIDSLRAIRVTQEVQALLIPQFATYNFDTFFPVIDLWIDSCGYHEPTLRTIIMEEILQKQPIDLAIQDYFNEGYYENYRNRVLDSWEFNYHDFYKDNVVYYGFLPLRSPLDTMLKNRAALLKDSTLNSPDEKLILQLFSEDLYVFEIEAIKKEYKNSYIGRYMRKEYRKERDQYPAFILGSGLHFPIGPFKTFGVSQKLTLGYSTPFQNNWVVDILLNFKFAYQPQNYNFYAMNYLHDIKAKTSGNFSTKVGVKMVDFYVNNKTRLLIHPKIGVGLEFISTKVIEEISDEEFRSYFPLTLNLSLGFTTTISVAKTSYLGLGFFYHFIPYNWDKRVKTKFDKNYMSIDLFWRI